MLSIKNFKRLDGNTTSRSTNGIKAKAQIRVEHDADLVLKDLKIKILGQAHDNVLLTTDRRFEHYKANEDGNILEDWLLSRKYYGETGSVKHYEIFIPKQLLSEVLRSLHRGVGKQSGNTKTIIAYKEKYYYPNMAQLTREWVMSCEQCIRESRIDRSLTRPPAKPELVHHCTRKCHAN